MVNYTLSDVISIIRVAYTQRRRKIVVPRSAFALKVLDVLYRNGCILSYKIVSLFEVEIYLSYYRSVPVTRAIKIISKPGARRYNKVSVLEHTKTATCCFFVVSTPDGVFTSTEMLLGGRMATLGEILLQVDL